MNEEILDVVRMGLRLGKVDRALCHPDGTPETTACHSVSLTWLACSLAREWYPELDRGLIAECTIVHDAVEVYAPDTPVVTAGEEGRRTQALLETMSLARIGEELRILSWLPRMITRYEAQDTAEARFARLADRIAGAAVLVIEDNVPERLKAQGATRADVLAFREYEEKLFASPGYSCFTEMDDLRRELNVILARHDPET